MERKKKKKKEEIRRDIRIYIYTCIGKSTRNEGNLKKKLYSNLSKKKRIGENEISSLPPIKINPRRRLNGLRSFNSLSSVNLVYSSRQFSPDSFAKIGR